MKLVIRNKSDKPLTIIGIGEIGPGKELATTMDLTDEIRLTLNNLARRNVIDYYRTDDPQPLKAKTKPKIVEAPKDDGGEGSSEVPSEVPSEGVDKNDPEGKDDENPGEGGGDSGSGSSRRAGSRRTGRRNR